MTALTEVLVLRGALPIRALDSLFSGTPDDEVVSRAVRDGSVSEADVAAALAAQLNVPFVSVADVREGETLVRLLPPVLMRRHHVFPIEDRGSALLIACADPRDVVMRDDVVAALPGRSVRFAIAPASELSAAVDRFVRSDQELVSLAETLRSERLPQESALGSLAGAEVDSDAPIVRFVDLLIRQAIRDHASDIHIEPQDDALRVRYRIDGVLHETQSAPLALVSGVVARLKVMSGLDIAERRIPQDGRLTIEHDGGSLDLRVASLPTSRGEKIVMRILDNTQSALPLEQLGFRPSNLERYERSFRRPHGLVLVTGPTGSGKSTTLYATLNAINNPEINVTTVEDPVEYSVPGINQIQVNPKVGLTFASALRAILRSDSDLLLLGEIRDRETAQIAIEAALTGHMVFATLHTNDAPSAVTRLIEMGIEPFLVASAVECVVGQRLARRLCASCREPSALGSAYRAAGCGRCSGTGYRGRLALHEVLSITPEIQKATLDRASSDALLALARASGMESLRMDGEAKIAAGETTVEEVLRVVG